MVSYIPSKGDIVLVNFNPQVGHEQMGLRPALIISNQALNRYTGLAIACPITSTIREYFFHVPIKNQKTTGVIMCEQIKSLDYNYREIKFLEKLNNKNMKEVEDILSNILELS